MGFVWFNRVYWPFGLCVIYTIFALGNVHSALIAIPFIVGVIVWGSMEKTALWCVRK